MPRIMIVDDNQPLLQLMADVLSDAETECAVYWDPRLARQALQAPPEALPSVIVLDVMMPGIDGFTFLTELQERGETRNIPVVVVTAKKTVVDVFRGQPNVFAFIEKPFQNETLKEAVARAAARR